MEFLKDVFGGEALTYEQLAQKLKGNDAIKLGNLAGGAYVGADKYKLLEAKVSALSGQLAAANAKLEGYDPDWKAKAEAAEQQAAAKVADLERGYAAEREAAGLKFSSASARRAFLAELAAKKLPLQDGRLLGFDDFAKQYKQADPGAFLPEGGAPRVTAGTTGSPVQLSGKDAANAAFRAIFGKE
nr:MAG TPA: minor structural protein [Caudoviricetes sp.]